MIQEQISLYYQNGSSDKEYHTQLVKEKGGFVVNFQYGRRGSTLQTGSKTPVAVTLEEATKIYTKLVKSKVAKGYSEGESNSSSAVTKVADLSDRITGILPQLLNELSSEAEFRAMMEDDDFVMQEKKDGECRLVKKDTDIIGINKKGLSVAIPKKMASSMVEEAIVHGESIGDMLYIWDILEHEGKSTKNKTYLKRLELLDSLSFGKNIQVVETAIGKKSKEFMLERLMKANAEGVVFKRRNHKYKEGRPASGGDVFKYKFYKTATVRVDNHTKGKRSVGMVMLEKGKETPVGKVTIPANKEIPEIGSYVEVRYLYAYKGGSLYQPTYKGERNDQDDSDINLTQLVYKA